MHQRPSSPFSPTVANRRREPDAQATAGSTRPLAGAPPSARGGQCRDVAPVAADLAPIHDETHADSAGGAAEEFVTELVARQHKHGDVHRPACAGV